MKLCGFVTAVLMLLAGPALAQVGYMNARAADPADQPLSVHIWYPTEARGQAQALGPYTHEAAVGAPIAGSRLPLVVISHGTGGSGTNQIDTAQTLARAGFVVAAVTHTGDNSRDARFGGTPKQFPERTRHVARVIDYMTRGWIGAPKLDPARIGLLGYSAGGTTALALVAGDPDFGRFAAHCEANPKAFDCRYAGEAQRRMELEARLAGAAAPPRPTWTHDPRVKAVVLAAPALGYVFPRETLRGVRIPVQLWAGTEDEVTPTAWNADAIRRNLPRPPQFRSVKGAGHHAFLPVCPPALRAQAMQICGDPPGFDRAAFRTEFNRGVTDFFRSSLKVR